MAGKNKDPHELVFRIDAFTPETLPLDRLAQYLAQLAALYGNPKSIHLESVRDGSAKVRTRVDPPAVDPTKSRLEAIARQSAPDDAMKAFAQVDEMLRRDGAIGTVTLGGTKLLQFPGRTATGPERIGPVVQLDSLDGELIRVGGKDSTVPVHLRENDGNIHACTANMAIAKQLAPYLYTQIRVAGSAHWFREESGTWTLAFFRIDSFTPLEELSLVDAVARFRQQDGHWDNEVLSAIGGIRGDRLLRALTAPQIESMI